MSHTPGLWRWVDDDDYPQTRLLGDGDSRVLSIYLSHGGGSMPSDADECLIAAAPDLLAACVEFVRKCECGEARSTRSYAQMKAAIAKAEGK